MQAIVQAIMNRKKFKKVVAKTTREDDIDYVTSSEEDDVNEPLDFEPNDELLPKPYRPNEGIGGASNALPRDENPGKSKPRADHHHIITIIIIYLSTLPDIILMYFFHICSCFFGYRSSGR